jgi:hypothetical protein
MSGRRRIFMFRRIHQLLPAAVGLLGVATAWADAGYLPLAGPLPLRFRLPPVLVAEHASDPLPPPPPAPIVLPTPPMPPEPPQTSNAAPAKMDKPVAVTNAPALEFDAREPVTGPASATSPDGVISPQMLIKYFTVSANPATNAAGVAAVGPIGFTPPPVTAPAPTPPAASKAAPSTTP